MFLFRPEAAQLLPPQPQWLATLYNDAGAARETSAAGARKRVSSTTRARCESGERWGARQVPPLISLSHGLSILVDDTRFPH